MFVLIDPNVSFLSPAEGYAKPVEKSNPWIAKLSAGASRIGVRHYHCVTGGESAVPIA